MKVEYIEPFVEAASNVLGRIHGCDPGKGVPGLSGTTFSTGCINITALVDGSLQGSVVYSMSTKTARKMAGLISGIEPNVFGRHMGGVLAELGNQLVERSRELLVEKGFACRIGRPTVFQGMNVEFSSMTPALIVPIETSIGQVDVSVAVDYDQQS